MEEIVKYVCEYWFELCVLILAFGVAIACVCAVVYDKRRKKRDEEYVKIIENIPVEADRAAADDEEETLALERGEAEMDWLKGKIGAYGVLGKDGLPTVEETSGKGTDAEGKTEEPNRRDGNTAESKKTESKASKKGSKKKGKSADKSQPQSKETKTREEEGKSDDIAASDASLNEKTDGIVELKVAVDEKDGVGSVGKTDGEAVGDKTIEKQKQLDMFEEEDMAEIKNAKKAVGKWVIKEKGEGEYVAYLYANNKEILLTSETYSSADGAKKGIGTIKKYATKDCFVAYRDKNGNHYFKLKTPKNRFLCSGETYANKTACLSSIESVKKFVDSPLSPTIEKDLTVIRYTPKPIDELAEKKYSGKWTINSTDGQYMAQLFASNGEMLLSSEAYASYSSARDAAKNITENGLEGNFIVDSDKKGRYFFKLRNSQKLVLCVGETYSQLSACLAAIDSARGFLKNAKLVDNS